MRTTYERDSYLETTITLNIIILALQTLKLYCGAVVHADNYYRVFDTIRERYYYYYYELCLCRVRP